MILFLTNSCSGVLLHLCRRVPACRLAIVDFSADGSVGRLAAGMGVGCTPFSSWENVSATAGPVQLIVSYRLCHIVPGWFVERSRYGGINIHPSLLPEYGGANPWFDGYCDFELMWGVTLHRLSEKPDRGNILLQQEFAIEAGEPLQSAREKADAIAVQLLGRVMEQRLYEGEGTPQSRPLRKARKYSCEDMLHFDARRLWHLLRGFPCLLPDLFGSLKGGSYRVGECVRRATHCVDAAVAFQADGTPYICCRDGIIMLLK